MTDLSQIRETILCSTGYAAPIQYVDVEEQVFRFELTHPLNHTQEDAQHAMIDEVFSRFSTEEIMIWALTNDRIAYGHHPAWGEQWGADLSPESSL